MSADATSGHFFDVPGFHDVDASDARSLIAYLDICTRGSLERKRVDYAQQTIGPGMLVLDVGCGTGDDVRAVAALVGPTGKAVGVDPSRAMVAEARRRGLPANAEVRVGSAEALAFGDATFDVCRAERVFQHLARPAEAAREMRRVLKPGGRVMLVDQDWSSMRVAGADEGLSRLIVGAFTDRLADGRAGRRHAALLEQAGFRGIRSLGSPGALGLGPAYALVLASAVECAQASGAISGAQAESWLSSLLAANRRGEFSYEVTIFATHASA